MSDRRRAHLHSPALPGDTSDIFLRVLLWGGFTTFILVMLLLDLFVVNRESKPISVRQSLLWTGVTVALALLFSVFVYFAYEHNWMGLNPEKEGIAGGSQAVIQYLTGWVTEYSLSLDNLFVISIVFTFFRVPLKYQHRVLFWGILGALVMRGAMIAAGAALIHRFSWTLSIFGVFLVFTAGRLLLMGDKEPNPEKNIFLRLFRRVVPVSPGYDGKRFFTRIAGKSEGRTVLAATPLFVVLLVVEMTDVVFAVDSIPAIFGITRDPFLVFSSNVFAILGLRSLYFAVSAVIAKFRHLKIALVFVLLFIGVKLLLHDQWDPPDWLSMCIVVGILGAGIAWSVLSPEPGEGEPGATALGDLTHVAEAAWRRARKWVILIVGGTVVLFGVALLVLPGPGLLVILVGFALLATEFVWAATLLKKLKRKAVQVKDAAQRMVGKGPDAKPGNETKPDEKR